ncbi:MAG: hypothetical protein A2293_02555 [Elusimicrobia bacterium RIFOXYB2_FULL_49_7]|nr:MAG: hypothetical protein A2293_02555 [Elusimicrobia bacterium RIFOXYB2_FULL_49_7]
MLIRFPPNTDEKLSILSRDSQYDLACACGTNKDDRRHRSIDDRWVYPVTLPDGGKSAIFKTLMSNVCANDCAYCPLRQDRDLTRCTLSADEIVKKFLEYHRRREVFGLFLSSGVIGTPDNTMDLLIQVARLLRQKEKFRGYIHLKILPGASTSAIDEALSLSSAVSLNLEVPGAANFSKLSQKKNYERDIIVPLKHISQMTHKGARFEKVRQTTQFIIGASSETDKEIINYTGGLYSRLKLNRVYFSAYQRGLGRIDLPGERSAHSNSDLLLREHRLYQMDFLLRKYRFNSDEIPVESSGFLSLSVDPKEAWARCHPEYFPVHVNRAGSFELLRVPGLGPELVNRILDYRKQKGVLRSFELLQKSRISKYLKRASEFVRFN